MVRKQNKANDLVRVGEADVSVLCVRHRRARQYVLRVRDDGTVRVSIPPFGSKKEALRFVQGQTGWIRKQLKTVRENKPAWCHGTPVYWRGRRLALEVHEDLFGGSVRLGDQIISIKEPLLDYRDVVTRHGIALARRELPPLTNELARSYGVNPRKVTVRNQRTLWGSCSVRGDISLNWRLLQVPEKVQHYVVTHELMHLKELNHSAAFWNEVERVCPDYEEAESWLKAHGSLLRT